MTATIMIISGFRASSRCRLSLSLYYSLGSFQRRLHASSHASHLPLHRYREMVEMTRRRIHGNGDCADKAKSPTTGTVGEREHHGQNGLSKTQPHTQHTHTHIHSHTHSHGIFGGHSHSHGHDGHDHGGGLIETLQSGGT